MAFIKNLPQVIISVERVLQFVFVVFFPSVYYYCLTDTVSRGLYAKRQRRVQIEQTFTHRLSSALPCQISCFSCLITSTLGTFSDKKYSTLPHFGTSSPALRSPFGLSTALSTHVDCLPAPCFSRAIYRKVEQNLQLLRTSARCRWC